MKILRVISSMNPSKGGPCQGIRNSISELNKLGIENEVVSLDVPESLYLKTDYFINHTLGPATNTWSYSSKLLPWMLKNLFRFDVIIVHGLWEYHMYAVHKAMRILKKKENASKLPLYYIMPHGMLDPYSLKSKGNLLKAFRKYYYWKTIEQKIVNNADGILFTCKEELLLARQSCYAYNPKSEINLGYGIQQPPVKNNGMYKAFIEKCPDLSDKPYLLYLSRIHEKKGVDLLIKAYQNLALDYPLPKLVIAGPGIDSRFGSKIKKLIKSDPKTSKDIFLPGMLEADEKWGAFYGCEAFILPSHQENFGIVVAEALACSKAVLISDQVNIWREIKNNRGGLVDKDDLTGTINLLKSWINMDELEKLNMSVNARQTFINHFSIRNYASNLITAFNGQPTFLKNGTKKISPQ